MSRKCVKFTKEGKIEEIPFPMYATVEEAKRAREQNERKQAVLWLIEFQDFIWGTSKDPYAEDEKGWMAMDALRCFTDNWIYLSTISLEPDRVRELTRFVADELGGKAFLKWRELDHEIDVLHHLIELD